MCGISRRHLAAIEAGANFTVAVLLAIAHELVEPAMPIADFLLRSGIGEGTPRPMSPPRAGE